MAPIDQWLWSPWIDLKGAKSTTIPVSKGLYRIRDASSKYILYVGETGAVKGLRGRLSQLRTCYLDEIPYADPHTAAPALWAYLRDGGGPLEVSILESETTRPLRLALEATYISILRKEYGKSPLLSFGRMPDGWIKSTSNNKRLAQQGKRMKGFRDASIQPVVSFPSILSFDENPKSSHWCGLPWSEWSEHPPTKDLIGLYRISRSDYPGLIYVGEGRIFHRLNAHKAKATKPEHKQSDFFRGQLLMSWTETPSLEHIQRLELENDLIASHYLCLGSPPQAQFLG